MAVFPSPLPSDTAMSPCLRGQTWPCSHVSITVIFSRLRCGLVPLPLAPTYLLQFIRYMYVREGDVNDSLYNNNLYIF